MKSAITIFFDRFGVGIVAAITAHFLAIARTMRSVTNTTYPTGDAERTILYLRIAKRRG